MTEPTEPKKRKPGWKDTPEKRVARQRNRREKLHKLALQYGYTTWYKLETALANDEFELVRKKSQIPEKL